MNRKDLQELARTRLAEARSLLRAGFPDGAYYLAGYAVECAIKARIAKQTQRHDFPPDKKSVEAIYTHDLGKLIGAANLNVELANELKRNLEFNANWSLVAQWSEQDRYRKHDSEAARALVGAIGGPRNGVMAWIKRSW